MTGPEHWAEANLILTGDSDPCSYGCPHNGCQHEMAMIARAQVHATLALAAATALGRFSDMPANDSDVWRKPGRATEDVARRRRMGSWQAGDAVSWPDLLTPWAAEPAPARPLRDDHREDLELAGQHEAAYMPGPGTGSDGAGLALTGGLRS